MFTLTVKARTAAAVASLRALVEITANVSDPVGRRAFADVRTGQVLLSIVNREHSSAVLQASLSLAGASHWSVWHERNRVVVVVVIVLCPVTNKTQLHQLPSCHTFRIHVGPTNILALRVHVVPLKKCPPIRNTTELIPQSNHVPAFRLC